ncbi:MAG: hypothetical protein JNL01_00540 [Bdellovibrionales bacterium]|nr:hypothetical protein [Bdellovibrionales bacterium]
MKKKKKKPYRFKKPQKISLNQLVGEFVPDFSNLDDVAKQKTLLVYGSGSGLPYNYGGIPET